MRRLQVIAACLLFVPTAFGQSATPDYSPITVIPRALPAITNPNVIAAKDADITDGELVIGVEIDGEARAYPINQLTGPRREIINDTLGGIAIAATW